MFSTVFSSVIFNPLYNSLIFFINHVPFADVGIAVILLTLLVKFALFPLAHSAIKSQARINSVKGELDGIRDKYKKDKQEQARQTMALYKKKGINPFSSILPLFIQLPIIIGLYWVFFKGGLPEINMDILYSFVSTPIEINMKFLGLIDMSGKSIILALLAGVTQFFQAKFSIPKMEPKSDTPSFKNDLARSFHIQMRYVFPVIVAIISYTISAAIALYWVTSNVFAISQEIFVKRKIQVDNSKEI